MEFILENDVLKVTVTTRGAQAKSVVRKEDGVEHIWCGDPEIWGLHAPILFPFCGRIKDGRLEARGQVAENCNAHGFNRNIEHTLVRCDDTSVVLELRDSQETRALWPYSFRLVSTFTLEGDTVHHTLTVENTDSEEISFGIGYHPAFAVPFDRNHVAEDYVIRFDNVESPVCLRGSEVYRIGTNINAIPVREDVFATGGFVMTGLSSKTVGLYEKDSGRGVVCGIRNFPYLVLWSKENMTPRFVCLEPWHALPHPMDGAVSSKWEDKPQAAFLAPGQDWSTTLSMSFVR